MLKRLSFFLSIFLIIGLVIGVGWFIRYRNTAPEPRNEEGSGARTPDLGSLLSGRSNSTSTRGVGSSTLAVPPAKPFGPVADQEVVAYYPYPDGSVVIIQPSGQIIRVSGTEGIILSSLPISNLRYAAFSHDGKKAVAVFGNSLSPQVSVFDVSQKSWQPLFVKPDSPPRWAPNDYRLAFLVNGQKGFVVTVLDTQSTTSNVQEVVSVMARDIILSWKSDHELLVSERPSAFALAHVLSLDIKKKTLTSLIKDWPGIDLLWDTTVQQGVVFQANKNEVGGKMVLVGASGVLTRQFSLTSLPKEKCLFDYVGNKITPFLLCAVPKQTDRFQSSYLPDDYLQNDLMTEDYLVQVDLASGSIVDLSAAITESIDATHLGATTEAVYFINRYNNKLYRLARK